MDEETQSNPRARRMARRREEILDAAARLFLDGGFHRTTTKDIAEAADIAEGTLYNYFDNKDAILLALMERLSQSSNLTGRISEGVPEEPRAFLVRLLRDRKDSFEANQPALQGLLSEVLVDPELRQMYWKHSVEPSLRATEAHLKARIEMGQVRPMDTKLLVRILTAIPAGLLLLDMLDDPLIDQEWDALTEMVADILSETLIVSNRRTGSDDEHR